MSDPADITAPKDPAAYRPARVLGPSFWAMISFGVLCVLAGAAIAMLGPRLLGAKPRPAPESARPAAIAPPPAAVPSAAPAVAGPAPAPAADIERLDSRVAALETHERGASQAVSQALAAAALLEASQSSRPFSAELAALRASLPSSPELATLSRLAETGAPSRATLAASFPDYAAHAAAASRAPAEGAGLWPRIAYALSKVVTLRRVGEVSGNDADAQLARAERMVEDGDLDQALLALDKLSPAARDALAPWRTRAEHRAEIDRTAAALRTRALEDMAAASRSGA